MDDRDWDAELHHWIVCVIEQEEPLVCIMGIAADDRRGVWADGVTVRTSLVLTPLHEIGEGAVVQTLNPRYRLVGPGAAGSGAVH